MSKSVFITDPDAFDKIARIEGEEWAKDQERHRYTGCDFRSFREAFQGETPGAPGFLTIDGSPAIYGRGGYNRYYVRLDTGEIVFSKRHATPMSPLDSRESIIEKARSAGFTIF